MKKVKDLKKWIELYNDVKAAADEVQLAYEYVKEGIVSEEELDANYAKAIELIENRKSGLGIHVVSYVHSLGRGKWI